VEVTAQIEALRRGGTDGRSRRPNGPAPTTRDRFEPAFAADGVDELLTCFVPRRSTSPRADASASLSVRCTDVDATWMLRIAPEGVTRTSAPASSARDTDCSVRGAAADLGVALWNRTGPEHLVVEGDPGVLGQFLQTVHVRWS
jgi:hypothetical protein